MQIQDLFFFCFPKHVTHFGETFDYRTLSIKSKRPRKAPRVQGEWITGATFSRGPEALKPIFADHDRASHAERWALLCVLRHIFSAEKVWEKVSETSEAREGEIMKQVLVTSLESL